MLLFTVSILFAVIPWLTAALLTDFTCPKLSEVVEAEHESVSGGDNVSLGVLPPFPHPLMVTVYR